LIAWLLLQIDTAPDSIRDFKPMRLRIRTVSLETLILHHADIVTFIMMLNRDIYLDP
jgi:hypothetical protein